MSQDPDAEPEGPTTAAADASPSTAPAPVEAAPDAARSEQLERRARLAEDRLAELLAAYRQVRTENESYRERVARELERQFDRRQEKLVLKFIAILDNLDRALEAAERSYAGNPMIDGLILVRTQLLQTLQREGLERIPALGLPYDPAFAEAVGEERVSDPDHDHVVVRELARGYRLHGRVARASQVVVGVYREAESQAAVPEPGTPAALDEPPTAEVPVAIGAAPASEEIDPAAQTIPIDEKTLREILGEPPQER